MSRNDLLKAKSDVQRQIGREAQGRLDAYADRLSEHVRAAEVQYGVTFRYDGGAPAKSEAANKQAAKRTHPARGG